MNKKSIQMSIEMVVILFVFILVAFTLFNFGGKVSRELKEDADIKTCKLSVLAQAQTRKVPVIGVSSPKTLVPLDCPRRKIKIFENKVELDGKKYTKYNFNKLSEEDVNKIVAEELRLCWYKMEEGNRDIFEHSWFVDFSGIPNICLICTELEFDGELKGSSFSGLVNYLKSNNMPKEKISYLNYLIRSQKNIYLLYGTLPWTQYTPWRYGTTNKIDDDKIYTNQKYTLYFLAYKPSEFLQDIKAVTTAYYIGLGKEDKIAAECSQLVN